MFALLLDYDIQVVSIGSHEFTLDGGCRFYICVLNVWVPPVEVCILRFFVLLCCDCVFFLVAPLACFLLSSWIFYFCILNARIFSFAFPWFPPIFLRQWWQLIDKWMDWHETLTVGPPIYLSKVVLLVSRLAIAGVDGLLLGNHLLMWFPKLLF